MSSSIGKREAVELFSNQPKKKKKVGQYPLDARGAETTNCSVPFQEKHLDRFVEIALEDMTKFFKQRPKLEKQRFCVVLCEEGADHYFNKKGFKCVALYTFFKKATCKDFPPRRHTRTDFGTDEFGHSSWIKHPRDNGFIGRGINSFGRSIQFNEDDTYESAIERYLHEKKTPTAKKLKKNPMVVLWPLKDNPPQERKRLN